MSSCFLPLFLILYISREALVAGRLLIEFTDLTTKLHQELNYDFCWAVNETSRILCKVRGLSYDDDDLEWYDLGECEPVNPPAAPTSLTTPSSNTFNTTINATFNYDDVAEKQ